jgi:hypothetical protein
MPCRYDPSPEELEDMKSNEIKSLENEINKLEAMLCSIISSYFHDFETISYDDIFNIIKNVIIPDTKNSGVTIEEMAQWYYDHREKDRLRREKEAKIFERAEKEAKEYLKTLDPKLLNVIKRIINDV